MMLDNIVDASRPKATHFLGEKHRFHVNELLSSDPTAIVKGLFELLCITFDESSSGGIGVEGVRGMFFHLGLTDSLAAPITVVPTEQVKSKGKSKKRLMPPDRLFRLMRERYQNHQEMNDLLGLINGVSLPDTLESTLVQASATPSPSPVSKPTKTKRAFKSSSSVSGHHRTTSSYPQATPYPPSQSRLELSHFDTFCENVTKGNLEPAKNLYKLYKNKIEGHKRWSKIKQPFILLLNKKGERGFIKKHGLN